VAIALLPSLAAGWLPPLLAKFHRQYPGIEIDVADVLSDACIERVRAGSADFALASTRTATPELHAEEFCRDRFHVVCPRDHALARQRGRIELSDLALYPIVQLARSSSVRQYVEAAIYPMQLRTMMELDQLSTVAGMVRAGLGITIVPSLTLFHFADPQLVTRPLHAPALVRRVYMVRRADRPLSTAAAGLHETLMAARPRVGRVAGRGE
jgi:DNA-binding transcriptional LysR family regulator